jgi:hypothetical protein
MAKALAYLGMTAAVIMLAVFGAHLGLVSPRPMATLIMDIGFIVCALLLGYLSWITYREQL